MRLPRARFSVGYRIGDYKIIKIFMDKHIRYLCVYENKTKPICYDLVDNILYFENMYKSRKSYYKKNSNQIIDQEIPNGI